MNSITLIVGQKIRALRVEHGLTTRQLANLIGMSQQQMSRYERGVNNICVETLFKLSLIFKINIDCFFSDVPVYPYLFEDTDCYDDASAMIDSYFDKI
ncbi:helix-turn-helix domain-containing protein [Morganella sp. B601]|uniref:helix-turn-helix domain-containing protein n=1 Tax=Morganella sp. B601 TaxID=3444315 RepID=UPI003EBDA227